MIKKAYCLSQEQYQQMYWWKNENTYYVTYRYYTGCGDTLAQAKSDIKRRIKEDCEEMLKLPVISQNTLEKDFYF